MSELPHCPECQGTYTYEDRDLLVCPDCGYEWTAKEAAEQAAAAIVTDANGVPLQDGDTVALIKDLKIKGSSQVIKVGTKVKNIRIVGGDHDIDCKVPGVGAMGLKSEFVKKV